MVVTSAHLHQHSSSFELFFSSHKVWNAVTDGVGQWWSHCTSKRLYKVSLERCPFGTGKFLVYAVDQT